MRTGNAIRLEQSSQCQASFVILPGIDREAIPKGPSASAVALNRPSSAVLTFLSSLFVNPSRRLIKKDMVVRSGGSNSTLNESPEVRFSLVLTGSDEVHATEKGCDVHNPSDGMYRYMYWPARKVHERAMTTSTRATSPGRSSTVAVVRRLLKLRQMTLPKRPALCFH